MWCEPCVRGLLFDLEHDVGQALLACGEAVPSSAAFVCF